MKEKLISRLIIGALAGVAAMGAQAGQIQSSSVSIAREVITSNTQAIASPTISYRFNGDVDARVQTQTFQVQLKLLSGKWASAGNATSIAVTDGVSGAAWTQGTGATQFSVIGQDLSTDKTILFATIQVTANAANLLKQPLVTFSAAATKPTINGLYDVVKEIGKCDTAVYNAQVEVSHFVGLSSPAAIAVNGVNGVADEHVRAGAQNTGTLIVFPTNILVKWAAADGNAKIDVTSSQTKFTGTASGTLPSYVNATVANLGKVTLVQNASGYDADLANVYSLAGGATTTPGIDEKATAALTDGEVEAKSFDVVVTPSNGFAVGSVVSLAKTADCAAANMVVNSAAFNATTAVGAVTLSVPTTVNQLGFGNTGTGPLYVCYTVDGSNVIPGSAFTVTGTLTKAAAGAGLNEQNEFCDGSLYPLGGSVKIDVRNYFNSKDSVWASQIRLINPDEIRTVDVYGQLIQKDGKYGPYGKLATLAPREAKNMLATEIDALLKTAPAHATAANNGDSTVQATEGHGARLRITSPNAQTLRVQNYLYNKNDPSKFLEASGSQAVDFSGSTDRAPASEGQYQSQDAWLGLNGGN